MNCITRRRITEIICIRCCVQFGFVSAFDLSFSNSKHAATHGANPSLDEYSKRNAPTRLYNEKIIMNNNVISFY